MPIVGGRENRALLMVVGIETDRGIRSGQLNAATSVMPPVVIVALAFQRHIFRGLTMGAVEE